MTSAGGRLGLPDLGYGVGLRDVHFRHLLHTPPAEWDVDWFEIISENFFDDYGFASHALEHVAAHRPVVMHGVSLSIGSTDPLDTGYLAKLRALADRVQPAWISDHLCWTGVNGAVAHDLLPMPLTRSSLDHVADRVRAVQDYLGRPLVLENPSTYLEFKASEIPEWEFLGLLAEETGCGLLVDVNNLFVGAYNHGFDPVSYIEGLPADHVVQVHLAGHRDRGSHLLDTHDRPVPDGVWSLYAQAQARTGGVSTLLEWDADIPPFPELVAELDKARDVPVGSPSATAASGPRPSVPTAARTGGCDLRALQGWMLDACVRTVVPSDPLDIVSRVRGSDRCSAEGRLEIYARGYLARLLDSLRNEYRVLRALVGDQVFDLFARGYLDACPPRSPSMLDLGAGFASYLEQTRPRPFGPPGAVDALPASLARLERARVEAGHARGVEGDAVDVAVDALRLMSTPGVVVCTPESLRLLRLDFPLTDVLDAVERGDQATVPPAADTCYAVARSRYRVRVHVLERWQFEFLSACGTGRGLPPAVATAAAKAGLEIDQVWAGLLMWLALAVDAGLATVAEE
ncbi:MAG TPA: DUF692 family protein [Acidimicrobiales bacterium]|nr:DUF692 family protein [Acidimicrobiales bacterium]